MRVYPFHVTGPSLPDLDTAAWNDLLGTAGPLPGTPPDQTAAILLSEPHFLQVCGSPGKALQPSFLQCIFGLNKGGDACSKHLFCKVSWRCVLLLVSCRACGPAGKCVYCAERPLQVVDRCLVRK